MFGMCVPCEDLMPVRQFLYARQNFDGTYYGIQMSGVHPSVCLSFHLSVCLSSVNMLHHNLRMTYPNFMKLNIVVSYDGQMICILFGENKI